MGQWSFVGCCSLFGGRGLTSYRDCDSPMSLVNMTFDWLKKEWADEVDFVIWTGDNAR
jgi:endopolyphosphatase